jgi:glycosyltransferase involved in cell wall biosynthesis
MVAAPTSVPRRSESQRISVVICAWTMRRWLQIVDAIDSVMAQEPRPAEVILVVDSNQELYERAQEAFPGVIVLENTSARGEAGARNTGLVAATGDIIVYLDDDATAAPGWLAALLDRYSNEQVVAVGGALLPQWQGGRPAWFPDEFDWVVGCTYRGLPEHVAAVRNIIGANMSFRRVALHEAGGFRLDLGRVMALPAACAETELCIRLQQRAAGASVLYDPQALVRHEVPRDRATWKYFVRRCYSEGMGKAAMARTVGSKDGLSSELRYTTRTLPLGILRYLRHGQPAKAVAIVAGLVCAAAGYVAGTVKYTTLSSRQPPWQRGAATRP